MLFGMPLGSFYNSLEESLLSRVVGCPSSSVSISIGVGVGRKGGEEEGLSDGMIIGVWLTIIGVSIIAGTCLGGGGGGSGLGVLGISIGLCLGVGVFAVIIIVVVCWGSGSFYPISFCPISSRPISFCLISHFPLATR